MKSELTLIELLGDAAEHLVDVRFLDDRDLDTTFGQIWKRSERFVDEVSARSQSGIVPIVLEPDPDLLACAIAAIRGGMSLASMPVPARGQSIGAYGEGLRRALASFGESALWARATTASLLEANLQIDARVPPTPSSRPSRADIDRRGGSLIQCTSGTTGPPLGVELSLEAIAANIVSFLDRLAVRPGDSAFSWLPWSHDMGFVGLVLGGIIGSGSARYAGGGALTYLRPESFLRSPRLWLEGCAASGATITATPPSVLSRVAAVGGTANLGMIRALLVGGEPIDVEALNAFGDAFGACGLVPSAICPAYGMAEVGLAVSISPPDVEVSVTRSPVTGRELVSCGAPVDGVQVRERRSPVSAGSVLDVVPVHPPVARWSGTGRDLCTSSVVHTADEGFLHEGSVFVEGRVDDYVNVGGRLLWAPSVEDAVSRLPHVRSGCVAVIERPSARYWLAFEPVPGMDTNFAAIAAAARSVSGVNPERICVLQRGTLPKTSSGKLRRHLVPLLIPE